MKRYKETEIKRNKKKNYRILQIESYDNISGYESYFMVTDYNKNIIQKFISWKMLENIYLKNL